MPQTYQYSTILGIPIEIELQWPFRRTQAGGDYYVLHGTARLLQPGSEELHAKLAVNLALTVAEELNSVEQARTEAAALNAVRKAVDVKDLEFIKSDKLQPVTISSRQYHFKKKTFVFHQADDTTVRRLLLERLYWMNARTPGATLAVNDPVEVQYTGVDAERISAVAQTLVSDGLIALSGTNATSTPKLEGMKELMEHSAAAALKALLEKHAFEARTRG